MNKKDLPNILNIKFTYNGPAPSKLNISGPGSLFYEEEREKELLSKMSHEEKLNYYAPKSIGLEISHILYETITKLESLDQIDFNFLDDQETKIIHLLGSRLEREDDSTKKYWEFLNMTSVIHANQFNKNYPYSLKDKLVEILKKMEDIAVSWYHDGTFPNTNPHFDQRKYDKIFWENSNLKDLW